MAVPFGSLIPQRSRVLPQGGAVLGQLTGTFQTGLEQGRMRAAEDQAPDLLLNYLETQGQGYQPTLGNLATPAAGYVGGQQPQRDPAMTPGSPTFNGADALRQGRQDADAGIPAPPPPSSGMEPFRNAITNIESGGRYDLLGPIANASGDRAYGRYQVMGANVGPWTEEALGVRMTPQQFLADPAAQDAVFDHVFGGYVRQYGPEGAARAWFTGSPTGTGTDVLGTTADRYVQMFNGGMGGAAPSTGGAPSGGQPATGGYSSQPAWSPPTGAERAQLRALMINPATRQMGYQLAIQRMTPPEPVQPNWQLQEFNGTLYRVDANTGQAQPVIQGQPGAAGDPFTLSPGQQRFDPAGNPIAALPAAPDEPGFQEFVIPQAEYAAQSLPPLPEGQVWVQTETGPVVRGAAGPQTVLTAERAYDRVTGEGDANVRNEIYANERNAVGEIARLGLMEQQINDPNFYSGANADLVIGARRLGVALGLADPDSLVSTEQFISLSNQAILDRIGGSLGTAISNGDRDFIQQIAANRTYTPEGNLAILGVQRALAERELEVARMARDYERRNNGRIDSGFFAEIAQWAEANPMFAAPAAAAPTPIVPAPVVPQGPPVFDNGTTRIWEVR